MALVKVAKQQLQTMRDNDGDLYMMRSPHFVKGTIFLSKIWIIYL